MCVWRLASDLSCYAWWSVSVGGLAAGLGVSKGIGQARQCLCGPHALEGMPVATRWGTATAFGGADVLFPKSPLLACISVFYIFCFPCFKCPSLLFLCERISFLFWNKVKIKGCYVEKVLAWSVHMPYIHFAGSWWRNIYKNFSFSFYSINCFSEFILVIWIGYESRGHLTSRNHNYHGLVMMTLVWITHVCVCACMCGGGT